MRKRSTSLFKYVCTFGLAALSLSLVALSFTSQPAHAQGRTWFYMPTGNGHGFQIFDRREGRITYFLEHPYRYVAPSGTNIPIDRTTPGVGRRDLAHDAYFGVSVNGSHRWLNQITDDVSYEAESNIIRATQRVGDVNFDSFYYAPFGLEANAMVMLIRARGPAGSEVSVFAKPNLKLGQGGSRTDPSDGGEELTWSASDNAATETGEGGGHAIYVPIGDPDVIAIGRDAALYGELLDQGTVTASERCQGASCVFVGQRNLTLDESGEAWWGMAVLFVNDNPNHPQAAAFRDERNAETVLGQWRDFAGDLDAKAIFEAAIAEWESWRTDTAPAELTEAEVKIWRQSEAVMRMGQIREPFQDNRRNYGMFLAALPIGEWHTGWVRDGVYAIAGMAMTGHHEEARIGVEFFLNAEKGVFPELGDQYRVSSCRYFGNGQEESDGNHAGPNLETDGWGLALWGASMYLQYSCDFDWLNQTTLYGDTVFEALYQIARDIDGMIEESTGLPKAEASIWEVHWDLRKTFTYTAAAQARGLYDFAQIAYLAGREDLANEYWAKAERMHQAILDKLVYRPLDSLASHRGVANQEVHVDGSTVEMLSWGLVVPDNPVFVGTLSQYDRLKTNYGGYRRLEPQLSLTGESGANEYDLSEWILLDLRIGDMWRLVGNNARADELLDKVTQGAIANDNLIPELYEPNSGEYAGVVPMVGYGAGAWQMSQLFKYNVRPPSFGVGYDHCASVGPAGVEMTGGEQMSGGAEMSGGTTSGGAQMSGGAQTSGESAGSSNAGTSAGFDGSRPGSFNPSTGGSDGAEEYNWESDPKASLCSARDAQPPWLLLSFWSLLGCVILRRRLRFL